MPFSGFAFLKYENGDKLCCRENVKDSLINAPSIGKDMLIFGELIKAYDKEKINIEIKKIIIGLAVMCRYVRYFNYTYQRSGTLWEGRFKSCVISAEEYFFICQRYIELNPVRANMVAHPADYKWSSYRFHAQESLDLQSELWQPHELYLKLSHQQETRAKRYQALFKYHIPEAELGRVRSATHSDMALGNERFKEEIEKLTGRRVTPRKRGRKPSQTD